MAVAAYTYDKLPPAEQKALPNKGHLVAALEWAEPDSEVAEGTTERAWLIDNQPDVGLTTLGITVEREKLPASFVQRTLDDSAGIARGGAERAGAVNGSRR
jgi:hypothetical protein